MIYFSSHNFKKKNSKKSKINRSIEIGTWHGEDASIEIIYENKRIEMKKRFRYENKYSNQHGRWMISIIFIFLLRKNKNIRQPDLALDLG